MQIIAFIALTVIMSANVHGHSGGTNAQGCHRNHSTGESHCHNARSPGSYERQMEGLAKSGNNDSPFGVIVMLAFIGGIFFLVMRQADGSRQRSASASSVKTVKQKHFSNSDVYEGDMVNGVPHGQGTLTKSKGSAISYFSGRWASGRMDGKIKYALSTGQAVYERDFNNGQPLSGKGRCTFPSGNTFYGMFHKESLYLFGPGECRLTASMQGKQGGKETLVVETYFDSAFNDVETDAIISAEAHRFSKFKVKGDYIHVRNTKGAPLSADLVKDMAIRAGYKFVPRFGNAKLC